MRRGKQPVAAEAYLKARKNNPRRTICTIAAAFGAAALCAYPAHGVYEICHKESQDEHFANILKYRGEPELDYMGSLQQQELNAMDPQELFTDLINHAKNDPASADADIGMIKSELFDKGRLNQKDLSKEQSAEYDHLCQQLRVPGMRAAQAGALHNGFD